MKPPFPRSPLIPFDPAAGLSEVSQEPRTYVEQVIAATSREDVALINRIVARFVSLFDQYGVKLTQDRGAFVASSLQLGLDVALVHYRTPLKLTQMLLGNDEDLTHDLMGIFRNVDRTNGQLRDGFRPVYLQQAS